MSLASIQAKLNKRIKRLVQANRRRINLWKRDKSLIDFYDFVNEKKCKKAYYHLAK